MIKDNEVEDALALDDYDVLSALRERLSESIRERCDCPTLELRNRVFANGAVHGVNQCLRCGRQKGGAIPRAKVLTLLNGRTAPEFDDSLNGSYESERDRLFERFSSVDARLRELSYVPTTALDAEAQAALLKERAVVAQLTAVLSEMTQVLGVRRASLFATRQLSQLHRQAWSESISKFEGFESESELRRWLEGWLDQDFFVHSEVHGVHLSGKEVQADYLLFPREHLIKAGFCGEYVSVEAKFIDQRSGFSRKASRAVWQAITYTQSTFDINGQSIRPAFGLLFSNLSFNAGAAHLQGFNGRKSDAAEWRGLLHLANHAGVGSFDMRGSPSNHYGWAMSFAGGTYFGRTDDPRTGAFSYKLSDPNAALKVRVGNF